MTGVLASVRDLDEAACALEAGVDLIDLKDPAVGALGALAPETASRIVRFIDGRRPVSATIGDVPFESSALRSAIERMAATGADIIKVGVFGELDDGAARNVLEGFCRHGVRIVLVLFAEIFEAQPDFDSLAAAGIRGVMLDTREKANGSLREKLSHGLLGEFVRAARAAGLLAGLAGSLRETDIEALVELEADYLGFRGALCRDSRRGARLDPDAVRRITGRLAAIRVGRAEQGRTIPGIDIGNGRRGAA